ncbi:MAG TPA: DUF374 domain-containing protein, partial [Pyrinomonadaceae bacterium]|nr:DUF374 domain-containing protein [Pyrinomonadaceae bacterium]
MRADYHISREKLKTVTKPAAEYFLDIQCLMIRDERCNGLSTRVGTRNLLTRTIDSLIALVRRYAPPIHWVGAALLAVTLFIYIRLVVLTSRLYPIGERVWPDVPAPGVIALWHRDAPSLLVAFAIRKPASPSYIMISTDPRGDSLALLCRMLGFQTVRGGGDEGGWEALVELSDVLANGASVFVTADGGGPARVVKVGALALASAASVPLLALSADSYPAI